MIYFVFTTDDNGRYSYEKQPSICRWNCEKLAESIKGAVSEELTKPHLDLFDEEYKEHYLKKIRKKVCELMVLPNLYLWYYNVIFHCRIIC